MATVLSSPGRERPVDGGVVWRHHLNAFECLACNENVAVKSRAVWSNPERLAQFRELMVLDHAECWEYGDARMARLQRRFRKELKRQMNLAARRIGEKVVASEQEST